MNGRLLENRRFDIDVDEEPSTEILDVLAGSDTPSLATDIAGHIVFWNRAAERLLGRTGSQVMGRRCYDVIGGRDVHGNRFCHEGCSIVAMTRRGEPLQAFEITVGSPPAQEHNLSVTVLKVPTARPEAFTLVHILQPIETEARLVRALERLGARRPAAGARLDGFEPAVAAGPVALPKAPPLTDREKEILQWVSAGLQNKEIAHQLGISLATVRNHIHNILEKLDVHSKLEAVSLAFRQGWVSGPETER